MGGQFRLKYPSKTRAIWNFSGITRLIDPKNCLNQTCVYWLILPNQQTLFTRTNFNSRQLQISKWAITEQNDSVNGAMLITINCVITDITLTAWTVSVFGVFLVRNFAHSDRIRRIFPNSVRMRENMDQKHSGYGHFSGSNCYQLLFLSIFKENLFWQWNICHLIVWLIN